MNTRCLLVATALLSFGGKLPAATIINFDDVTVSSNSIRIVSPTRYASRGVTIQTIVNATDGLGMGDTFTADLRITEFGEGRIGIYNPASGAAVSPPNIVIPLATSNGSFRFLGDELLLSFGTPVYSASVVSDDFFPEGPHVVRLLALRSLGNQQFEILAVASGFDNATSSPANLLAVGLSGGFSYALIETTTEFEGFDDLTFEPVPEPSYTGLVVGLSSALLCSQWRSRRPRLRT